MPQGSHERTALRFAFLVACLGVFWTIWSVPLVMTNDGPQAVLTAHMEAHYDDPGSIYARQFSLGFGLSGRGFSILYRPLAAALAWPNSLRVSQLIMILAVAFGVGWLSKAVSGRAQLSSLLGFAIAFCWPFYMGLYAFTISMAVGLMVLAFVVSRTKGLRTLEKVAVSTALLVQLFMHGFAVFITLALIALVIVTRAVMQRTSVPVTEWRRATVRDAAWLAVTSLPSVVVLIIMRTAVPELSKLSGAGKTEWASPSDWVRVLPRLAVPGSTGLGVIVFAIALIAIARTAVRVRRSRGTPEEVALAIGASGLLVAAVGMPLNVPGWQFFSPRFLTTGLALSLCLLGREKLEKKQARVVFDVGVVALVGVVLVSARALHQRMATDCEDALLGLERRIGRSAFQLPIGFDVNCNRTPDDTRADVPYLRPLAHFYALFPVVHGGAVPYGFFGPAAVHAFVPRLAIVPIPPLDQYWRLAKEDPRFTHPEARAKLLTDLVVFGTKYENLLLFGASTSDRALLLDRGYVIDFEHDSFVNAHYDPCFVEVVSDVLPGDPAVMVEGGIGPHELRRAKLAPLADGRSIKASMHMLCGDGWARVHWMQSETRCANSDVEGRIAFHADHASTTHVVCERSPAP